jgi:hypothetical protein
MIRVKGGLWDPRRKHSNLARAMEVAFIMAEKHQQPATILQSISEVTFIDGKAIWEDKTPEK